MKRKIVCQDDQVLYPKAIIKAVDPSKDQFLFIRFQHPDNCLNYIYNSINSNSKIDVIIRGYNHPGMNGLEFPQAIKAIEATY